MQVRMGVRMGVKHGKSDNDGQYFQIWGIKILNIRELKLSGI